MYKESKCSTDTARGHPVAPGTLETKENLSEENAVRIYPGSDAFDSELRTWPVDETSANTTEVRISEGPLYLIF